MREKILNGLAEISAHRPWLILFITAIVTVLAAALSGHLKLEMQFKNLMPQHHPMVREFNKVVDNFSTATMIVVAAQGNQEELKRFADELAPKIREMNTYIQRVDYKIDRKFLLEHGMMLQKVKDLENSLDIYRDLNLLPFLTHLNDNFEKTYIDEKESISTKEKENNAVAFLDGIKAFLLAMENYSLHGDRLSQEPAKRAVDQFLIGDEYIISPDKTMLLMFARPSFSINEIDKVILVENRIDSLIHQTAAKYPSLFAGTTGTMALSRDETVAANQDMYLTSLIAFALIIALFIFSFRMWVAPLLAGIVLIIGIVWTMGFTAVTLGSLNIMTSMFSVILMGLGIDFSIHIISGYTECRAEGRSMIESIHTTLNKSGKGIITGGVTTAMAFLTLIVSETAGMKEFGIVAGSGVMLCLVATIAVLPSLLIVRDRLMTRIKKGAYSAKSTEFHFLGNMAERIGRKPWLYLILSLLLTIVFLSLALRMTFDYNYLNMEPVGLTSLKLQDQMEDKFDITPDFSIMTTHSIEESRRITREAKKLKMIGMVSSLSEYIPSPEEQAERKPYLDKIRHYLETNQTLDPISADQYESLIDELYRLQDNVVELAQLSFLGGQDKVDRKCKEIVGDLDNPENQTLIRKITDQMGQDRNRTIANLNRFTTHYVPCFREKALGMSNSDPITLDMLPDNIVNQFANDNRSQFLVTVYPKEGIWKNLEFLERFTRQMTQIDQRMTGLPLIFYVLIHEIAEDGELAFGLTFIVILLLLILDFKSIKYALLAMIPLVIGAIWMVGIMKLCGLQLTMLNMMGLPLILGIGIDDGVHILHRYQIEGSHRIGTVFRSTGKAVLLTSLTTMLAFGSLYFATYRGLGSLGIALFIGVGACFVTTVVIMPAIISLLDKSQKQIKETES